MKKLIYALLLLPFMCFGGNGNYPSGGRSAGMGHASVALSDVWSVQNNQAGLAFLTKPEAGIYYENHFGLKQLGYNSGAFALPLKTGVFGVSLNYFGYENYNEKKLGLGYAMKLGKNIAAGVQLDYLSTYIADNYGTKGNLTFEAGILANLSKNLNLGVHIFNPYQVKLSDYNNEKVPSIFRLGLSYKFSDNLITTIETEKESSKDPAIKAGVEYKIIEPLYVRAGISTNPVLSSFGVGLNLKNFKLDFASTLHPALGFSPQVSLIYQF